jgi:hypothetical protein
VTAVQIATVARHAPKTAIRGGLGAVRRRFSSGKAVTLEVPGSSKGWPLGTTGNSLRFH